MQRAQKLLPPVVPLIKKLVLGLGGWPRVRRFRLRIVSWDDQPLSLKRLSDPPDGIGKLRSLGWVGRENYDDPPSRLFFIRALLHLVVCSLKKCGPLRGRWPISFAILKQQLEREGIGAEPLQRWQNLLQLLPDTALRCHSERDVVYIQVTRWKLPLIRKRMWFFLRTNLEPTQPTISHWRPARGGLDCKWIERMSRGICAALLRLITTSSRLGINRYISVGLISPLSTLVLEKLTSPVKYDCCFEQLHTAVSPYGFYWNSLE